MRQVRILSRDRKLPLIAYRRRYWQMMWHREELWIGEVRDWTATRFYVPEKGVWTQIKGRNYKLRWVRRPKVVAALSLIGTRPQLLFDPMIRVANPNVRWSKYSSVPMVIHIERVMGLINSQIQSGAKRRVHMAELIKIDLNLWEKHATGQGVPAAAFDSGLVMTLPSGETLGFEPKDSGSKTKAGAPVRYLKPMKAGNEKGFTEWGKVDYGTKINVTMEVA